MKILLVSVCVCLWLCTSIHCERLDKSRNLIFSQHTAKNNQALGRVPQLKYSFLKKRQADGVKKISSVLPPPVQPLAGNRHLLTCEQLRYYRASQTSGSNIIPNDSAALCCFDLVYTHTHLSSRASRASSILST